MKKWFRGRSLIHKITIIITGILIIPMTIICGFYYNSYEKSLIKEADNSLKEDMSRVENEINANLDTARNVMDEIAYSQELIYFLDAGNQLSEGEISRFFENIQGEWINIRYAHPNMFTQMTVYSSNRQLNADGDWKFALSDIDYMEDDLDMGTGKVYYGKPREPRESVRNGESSNLQIIEDAGLRLPVYLKVQNVSTDEVIGTVELDIPLEKLVNASVLKSREQKSRFLMLDEEGRIVYQTGGFSQEEVKEILGRQMRQAEGLEAAGETYRVLSSVCKETNLTMAVLIEEDAVVLLAREMIWKVGFVALLGILCIMGMTYLVIKRTLNRLVVMDEVMAKVEMGELDVIIEDDGYNDEVSRTKRRFNQMTIRLQEVIQQMIDREKAQKEAELRALQAQINPHFLYNTLETMRMQCEYDRYYKISDSLSALGEMFRYTMRWKGSEVPFSQEWNNLKNYISIMALRLDDDFEYELECQEETGDVIVPKMLLQPIVENSFRHGFKGVAAPWKLRVTAQKKKGFLQIEIVDNGSGIAKDRLSHMRACMQKRISFSEEGRQSIGIINVLQRMDMVCGPGSDIFVENREEGGIRILIYIAAEEEHVSDIGGR